MSRPGDFFISINENGTWWLILDGELMPGCWLTRDSCHTTLTRLVLELGPDRQAIKAALAVRADVLGKQ